MTGGFAKVASRAGSIGAVGKCVNEQLALSREPTRSQLESEAGSRRRWGALDEVLSPADICALEAAIPRSAVAGTLYDEDGMRMLDSELSFNVRRHIRSLAPRAECCRTT